MRRSPNCCVPGVIESFRRSSRRDEVCRIDRRGFSRSLLIATAVATAAALAPAVPPVVASEPPLPEKITSPPEPDSAPTVTIRNIDNGDRVEEYRENGRLTMVKVTPKNGPAYTLLDANGDGKLDRRDTEGPVAPVYWKLYEWN